jgi:NADH-quinone oxidoreductase subunit L|tara:strand:+ start:1831 stop:3855 length:2025 start_codon:yes stop_codon:yes gene_type:complete
VNISEFGVWLIILVPLGTFLVNGLVIRPFLPQYERLSGWLTIASLAVAFGLSVMAYLSVNDAHGAVDFGTHEWLNVSGLTLSIGILLDPLTAIMLIVVSGVSLMVQIYSQGYMKGDPSYIRYYAFMSLFTASMLGLVTSRNIIQLFVFWELVGVSSYLLIGFWFTKPSAAAAAKKAFIVTRFGDFGFLIALLALFAEGNEFLDIPTMYTLAGTLGATTAGLIALGIFAGAVGKSAQFPLHTWLPDAMEGPTPVSALIHSATMVTAGVFLVARMFPLFEAGEYTMEIVALVGAFTAVFAASMGLVAHDIKRVLAYSTVSQLGYMMLILGLGGYVAAIFHLFTHAFFKALLFLGSGSVNHATGTFDMRYMGGLRKVMPWTFTLMVIGSLSLAGIFPLAGFWSKDEILAHAAEVDSTIGWIALAAGVGAAFMTAFYMFRVIWMTFGGEYRGGAEAEAAAIVADGGEAPEVHGHPHLGESPWVMLCPMLVLAVLAVGAGFLANPPVDIGVSDKHEFGHFATGNEIVFIDDLHDAHEVEEAVEHAGASPEFNWNVAIVSSAVALIGIYLAYLMYGSKKVSSEHMASRVRPVYTLLYRKYFMDELYEDWIVKRLFYGGIVLATDWFDRSAIDAVNVKLGIWTGRIGKGLGQVQNGQMQVAGLAISVGVVASIAAFLVWGS